jgi:hypothetical protein
MKLVMLLLQGVARRRDCEHMGLRLNIIVLILSRIGHLQNQMSPIFDKTELLLSLQSPVDQWDECGARDE